MKANEPKIGRPKIEIDVDQVKKMFALFCTGREVAEIIGVCYDTLEKRIKEATGDSLSDFIKKSQAEGKKSLRKAQYDKAIEGNTTMLIWLGKQFLGQKEPKEPEPTQEDIELIIDLDDGSNLKKDKLFSEASQKPVK